MKLTTLPFKITDFNLQMLILSEATISTSSMYGIYNGSFFIVVKILAWFSL